MVANYSGYEVALPPAYSGLVFWPEGLHLRFGGLGVAQPWLFIILFCAVNSLFLYHSSPSNVCINQ